MKFTRAYIVSPSRYVLLTDDDLTVAELYSVMRAKPHKILPLFGRLHTWNIALTTGGWKSSFTVAELIEKAKGNSVDLPCVNAGALAHASIRKLIDFGIIDQPMLTHSTKAKAVKLPQSQQQLKCWVVGTVRNDGSISFATNPKQHVTKASATAEAERLAKLNTANSTVLVFETVFGAVKTNVSTFEL